MVNLELYRVFYTVAKCGSLTKAAEELYISQPAVSQSIKQLENQLGTPLFNRTHRGMELSAQGGKLIFSEVERALGLFNEAESLAHNAPASAAYYRCAECLRGCKTNSVDNLLFGVRPCKSRRRVVG